MNISQYVNHIETNVPTQLYEDTHHIYPKLECLLLCKIGILNFKKLLIFVNHVILVLKKGKLPIFSLTNGMWIGKVPPFLPNLTIVKEALIAQFRCCVILIKLQYANNTITQQQALKGNLVSFFQDPILKVELIKSGSDYDNDIEICLNTSNENNVK